MKIKIILGTIVLAFILRFYALGNVPGSLNWDENSNLYNAYSILKTGKDEYGTVLPLYNRSFGDYKPPLYMYLDVFSVLIWGTSNFAARFPSALLGTFTVVLFFFLVRRFFSFTVASTAALFMALSPWHLQFSRVGLEANIGLFFTILSFTVFLFAVKFEEKPKRENVFLLLFSAVLFSLSFYTYHSVRILTPVLFLATSLIFRKNLIKFTAKIYLLFLLIVFLLISPFFIFSPKEAIQSRLESTSLATITKQYDDSVKFIRQDQDEGQALSNITHNRRVLVSLNFFKNYLSHFDFNFLFTKGDDNLRHHIEGMGMLFLYQLPLVIFGIYFFIKDRTKKSLFFLAWFLISPIAAAPTNAVPHAIRAMSLLIPLQLFTAYSVIKLKEGIRFNKAVIVVSTIILSLSLFAYLHNYYFHYAKDKADVWQYGYQEAAIESQKLENKFDKIFIDDSIEQGYVFWLVASKFDPKTFQENHNTKNFGKFFFERKLPDNQNELFISSAEKFPVELDVIKTIYYPNGTEAIKMGRRR